MNKKNKIKIKLNGKIIFIPKNTSLKNLASKFKIPLNKVAIEVNMEIIIWIGLFLIIGKFLLKAFAPYTNKALEEKIKEYWENLRSYF